MTSTKGYTTKQRDLIMKCLLDNRQNHLTAEDVVTYLKKQGTPVGKTTVYRYLEKLSSDGEVHKYFIEDRIGACFQYSEDKNKCNEHFHMKCVYCGKLIHLECEYLNEIQTHVGKSHNFKIDKFKTVFYGRCDSCES